ncbi:hypothetical protein ACN28S_28065 [Cystobacter fuscus]
MTYILTKVLQLTLQETLVLQTRGGDLEELSASLLRTGVSAGGFFLVSLWLYYLNTLVVARYVVPTQLGDGAAPPPASSAPGSGWAPSRGPTCSRCSGEPASCCS